MQKPTIDQIYSVINDKERILRISKPGTGIQFLYQKKRLNHWHTRYTMSSAHVRNIMLVRYGSKHMTTPKHEIRKHLTEYMSVRAR